MRSGPHHLIVGVTLSGKSTLLRRMAASSRASGRAVLVLDPIGDPRWPTDPSLRFTDPEAFLDLAQHSLRCDLVIDEAGRAFKRCPSLEWSVLQGRHNGHRSFLALQRAWDLDPSIRDQCANLWAFRQSVRGARILADEYATEELLEAANLPAGTCLYVSTAGGGARRVELFS